MLNYLGIKCPVCEKEFKETDDIVVCPICGAPYHRHCYEEKGECIFNELHETGASWEAPVEEKKTSSPYEIKDQECPRCGVLNSHSALFCSNCAASLKKEKVQNQNPNFNAPPNMPPMYTSNVFPNIFDPMGGVSPNDLIEDDISYGDISKVVQQNTKYYLPVFKKKEMTGKGKFNFSAFIFSGAWLLYRKQYKPGLIITLLMFMLYLGQTFAVMFISTPRLANILNELGEPIKGGEITTAQMALLMETLTANDIFIISLPLIMLLCMLVIMVIVGFNGNNMYMKHCIKTVKKSRKSTINQEDYNTKIIEVGGVNTSASVCVFVCYTLCNYLPMIFLG